MITMASFSVSSLANLVMFASPLVFKPSINSLASFLVGLTFFIFFKATLIFLIPSSPASARALIIFNDSGFAP